MILRRGSMCGLMLAAIVAGACALDQDEGILMAAGSYGDLAVVLSDDSLSPAVQPFLQQLNAPLFFVNQTEEPFNIDLFGPDKWKLCRHYKNILFVVRWGDGGAVEKAASSLLSDESLARLRSGSGGLAQISDPYARYQLALMAAAADRNTLASLLVRQQVKIRQMLQHETLARIQRQFRHTGLQEELMARYWQQHRFMLEIPRDYRENQDRPEGFPGIEWMRNAPSRGITLAWQAADDPLAALQDRALLLDMRRRLGQTMHREELVAESLAWSDTTLGSDSCVKLTGAWISNAFAGGGPFWSYYLADTRQGRLLCLDLLVYAPGEKKMPYFREMEAIASTFSLRRPQP